MKLIGIVGMPGSGKTKLFNEVEYADFEKFDDVLADREPNEYRIRTLIQQGKPTLVSDIEFCNANIREKFEQRIGKQVEWICFENDPWKCAVNCLYRFYSGHDRPLQEEIRKIGRLTRVYQPFWKVRPIKGMSPQNK